MQNSDTRVVLGLGSNVGDRLEYLQRAFDGLGHELTDLQSSCVYETPPWGIEDQGTFLNMVAMGTTRLNPEALFTLIKTLEKQLGRVARERYGPREIDIDILSYGDLVIETPILQVPHPQLGNRAFVLIPLAELMPEWIHPVSRRTAVSLLAMLRENEPATATRFSTPLPSKASR